MKWRIKKAAPLKRGETRLRRIFAWRKMAVGDYWIWLQFYYVEEKYFMPVGGGAGWWSEIRRYVPTVLD